MVLHFSECLNQKANRLNRGAFPTLLLESTSSTFQQSEPRSLPEQRTLAGSIPEQRTLAGSIPEQRTLAGVQIVINDAVQNNVINNNDHSYHCLSGKSVLNEIEQKDAHIKVLKYNLQKEKQKKRRLEERI